MIRSKIIKVGNSRGIRIPRSILEQAGLMDEVEMTVQDGKLIVRAAQRPRQGWRAQFSSMTERGDDRLLDEPTSNKFDDEEWSW